MGRKYSFFKTQSIPLSSSSSSTSIFLIAQNPLQKKKKLQNKNYNYITARTQASQNDNFKKNYKQEI